MSYIEHPDSWFPEFNRESGNGKYDVITEMVNSKKKCCETCEYYDKLYYSECYGNCAKHIVNESLGKFIENSGTFYCSYHKFKV